MRRSSERCFPFPSHEVDPYRGLAPHFDVASARARALHALTHRQCRLVIASARRRSCRASARRSASIRLPSTLTPGSGHLADRSRTIFVAAGYTRQDPVDEHGEFCVRGGIVDFFPAGAREPIRLEFVGDTIESIRTYDPVDAAIDRRPRSGVRSPRCGSCSATETRPTVDRRSTTCGPTAGRRSSSPSPTRSRRTAQKLREQIRAQLRRRRCAKGERAARRQTLRRRLGRGRAAGSTARPRSKRWRSTTSRRAHRVPAGAGVPRPRAGLGRRDPARREARRDDRLRRRLAGARRADDRAARGLRHLRRADRARRGRPVRARCSSPSAQLSRGFRLPDAGLQIYAETDVFEEERRAPERRRSATKAFLSDLRDLKVGDLVVHVDHGIGVFVGLKQIGVGDGDAGVPRAALRRRRQAVRSGRAARSRPEVHRRGAAAARSARRHDVGAREDARQEGHARHGRGAAQALRRAQGGPRPRLQPRLALAAGVRGRVRVRADARPDRRRSPTSSATWSRRRRWTACSAATSATARPRSRCAPRSRR